MGGGADGPGGGTSSSTANSGPRLVEAEQHGRRGRPRVLQRHDGEPVARHPHPVRARYARRGRRGGRSCAATQSGSRRRASPARSSLAPVKAVTPAPGRPRRRAARARRCRGGAGAGASRARRPPSAYSRSRSTSRSGVPLRPSPAPGCPSVASSPARRRSSASVAADHERVHEREAQRVRIATLPLARRVAAGRGAPRPPPAWRPRRCTRPPSAPRARRRAARPRRP